MEEVLARCEAGEVPCGPVYTIADIFRDAQYQARENLLRVVDERAGPLVLPAAVPRLSETPAEFKHAGRALGVDTAEVLGRLLGMKPDVLRDLSDAGVI
jgi:crotonobetainyl-CoA:carnitine CoA-transferase CaiB-like acyl-CoA transferase